MKPLYVLYQEHDNRQHDVSIHRSQAEAEVKLLATAQEILGEDWGDIESGMHLVNMLYGCGEYFRIYRVTDGGSTEVNPDCFKAIAA